MHNHHAFLYQERSPEAKHVLIEALRAHGVVTLFLRSAWGIDDSRALALEVQHTDPVGRERLFVLDATSLTVEAQNALLKVLEEPPRGVSFHCFFAAGAALLPTVLSRLSVVGGSSNVSNDVGEVFAAWQRLPIAGQLGEIEKRTKDKDQVWIEAIKQGALAFIAPHMVTIPQSSAQRLYFALTTIGTRGASNKMLLEEVALTMAHVSSATKAR
ncbi:hypothetical protein K2Q16_03085 [Patescibacteria group bacterium]|nr:hypothetical protein [Patescibacteria group bacterium]